MSKAIEPSKKKEPFFGIPSFWMAQQKDWRTTVIRTSLSRLAYQIIYPYLSLYIVALGAQKTELGTVMAIGLLISALLGPVTGGWIARQGTKKVYLVGIAFVFAAYMTYALAGTWQVCIAAMILYYIGIGTASHVCGTICGSCLRNCDRAKGMLICESLAAGLLGIIGPQIAILILVDFVHCNPDAATAHDYHYLFFVAAAITVIQFFVVMIRLSNTRFRSANAEKVSVLKEGGELLRSNKQLKKWIIVSAIGTATQGMVMPYIQVFAGEVKMASVATLGTMVTAQAVTSMILGYFVGGIADRVGRKKVLCVIWPLYWISLILLMTAKSSWMLILSGILQGFYNISLTLTATMSFELVSAKNMSTWLGITRLTGNLLSAILAVVGGAIYDTVGPFVLFTSFILLEACVKLPLMLSVPETLHDQKSTETY